MVDNNARRSLSYKDNMNLSHVHIDLAMFAGVVFVGWICRLLKLSCSFVSGYDGMTQTQMLFLGIDEEGGLVLR